MNRGFYRYALVDLSELDRQPMPDTLGIEVTEPSTASCCGLGNIDPQHGSGIVSAVPAAIEVCLDYPLPPEGTQLLTVRPDLDALGAMAVLLIRASGLSLHSQLRDRVARIAAADRFDYGPWPGPRALPRTVDEVLEDGNGEALAVLAACVFDATPSLGVRVAAVARWLMEGCLPQNYRTKLRRNANSLLLSLNLGATRVAPSAGGQIATVVSVEPGTLRLGYCLAPVVVALNPAFQFHFGEAGRKYTLARWAEGDADLDHAVALISKLESGWGGQRGIKGSSQRGPSRLPMERIVKAVAAVLPGESVKISLAK